MMKIPFLPVYISPNETSPATWQWSCSELLLPLFECYSMLYSSSFAQYLSFNTSHVYFYLKFKKYCLVLKCCHLVEHQLIDWVHVTLHTDLGFDQLSQLTLDSLIHESLKQFFVLKWQSHLYYSVLNENKFTCIDDSSTHIKHLS